ncbi:MAG TPA: bifunctional methylenetetrahydrofolate dehydrogenase/methenyltetrahydrofolate cyclohydrolase FolD [Tepidiformaceae bacterium]|nr:bifunctional methylenetetrahydrofolate dehydrogenase/methenyltetrahydrofolate cyclohydrolase FolD [Tepidiformaceae bacterium]
MTAQIIDGLAIAAEIRAELVPRIAALKARGVQPGLAAILVGDDPASVSYVSSKAKTCAEMGIFSETFRLPAETSQAELFELVAQLNADERFHAILPQLPVPPQIDERAYVDAVDPRKDADGLHPVNLGRLLRGELDGAIPCTPNGVVQLLARTGNDPAGKHVVVVGRSTLVGRPLAVLLSNKARGGNATVTICHTATPDIGCFTREADIVVIAAGRPNTLTAGMVRPGAVVIDVGTNRIDDASRKRGWRLVGDSDFDALKEVASWITPVPGGVGPMTIAMLLVNTVVAAEQASPHPGPLPTARERE